MSIRNDFPVLGRHSRGRPLVYLDNAATTQKPQVVIDAISRYYQTCNANVHRAAHDLAEQATTAMEDARAKLCGFIHARQVEEIIFTRGTTESINLVANVLTGRIQDGHDIVITELEHHSNIVPWQMLAQRTGARLKVIHVDDGGNIDLNDAEKKITQNTALVAFTHVSNGLGNINPVQQLIDLAKSKDALTLVDGAQAALHLPLDVQTLDCDFYVFSGHKVYAPTGIGVLYGRYELLCELPPWQGGGEMIEHVTFAESTYQLPPYRFEAGTPNIADTIGLGAAIDYLQTIPRQQLAATEDQLVAKALAGLQQIPGVRIVGEPERRLAVISFLLEGGHPNDVGTLLDQQGVAVRAGHHCNMPLMQRLDVPGTVRASFSLYNNEDDVTRLLEAVDKAKTFL
ncbi:MAG: cysteine desulfurase CsdA [Gammaproteobacteria bacterium]|nr:cysteine desulfurase CsdA [Gammaproteobacteria bacterium]|tara:strand:- start:720 stop:1919 length:1200 start_codon:yes stop_codon:yes gene_type:complete